jgi:hypothetical protein
MVIIACLLMLLVIPLQLLGYTDTCTQGGPDGFTNGVFVSSPLLLAVSVIVLRLRSRPVSESALMLGSLITLAVLSVVLVAMNFPLLAEILFGSGHPCGPDYAYHVPSLGNLPLFISFLYGFWPAAIGLASTIVLYKGWKFRSRY